MSTFTYLKNFIKDRQIASVTPTSRFGVRRVCRYIDFAKADLIVEYGPATGVFIEYLLKEMKPNSCLIAFETNTDFVRHLKNKYSSDSRLRIINDSAEFVADHLLAQGFHQADFIISGIPFSFFSLEKKKKIIKSTYDALRLDGKFLVYQFLTTSRRPEKRLKAVLASQFEEVNSDSELRNVPPLKIYEAIKRGESIPNKTAQ